MQRGRPAGRVKGQHQTRFDKKACAHSINASLTGADFIQKLRTWRSEQRQFCFMDLIAKKKALLLFTNGMYIITSRFQEHYGAATVTWVSQASFKPPLVMAALRRDSNVFQCVAQSGFAAIHIIGHDQQQIAQNFFNPTSVQGSAINGEPIRDGITASPILFNFPAHVECRVVRLIDDAGDHAVVVFEVVEAECRNQVQPLTIAESPWRYGG